MQPSMDLKLLSGIPKKITKLNIIYNPYLVLTIAGLLLLAYGINGTQILSQGDEYMHIATVRDSLLSGQYLLPQLDGMPNYFKPPILFWFGMISETILGNHLYAVRLPALLAGISTTLVLFYLLRYLGAPAFFPSLLYLLCLGTMKFSRLLMMEQFLALAFLGTACLFIRFIKTRKLLWLFFSGLISSLAYFLKGPLFQVYAILLLIVWGSAQFLHFRSDGSFASRKSIKQLFTIVIVFHIPLIIPMLWNLYLFAGPQHDYGKSMLRFFFVNENLSKFGRANQPESAILLGWLLYSFPWTIFFIGGIFQVFRKSINTPNKQLGKMLLVTALAVSLLHLLPNRKDPYYIIPVLPLFIASFPLMISEKYFHRLNPFIRANVVFSGIVSILILLIGIVLKPDQLTIALMSISPLLHFGIVLYFRFQLNNYIHRILLVTSGAFTMLGLQFLLLPALSLPLIPQAANQNFVKDLCVVSNESWDGFAVKMLLPKKNIRHKFPGDHLSCERKGSGMIVLEQNVSAGSKAIQVYTWKRWKGNMSANYVIKHLGDIEELKRDVFYYEFTK